jgi:hypothetical protein
MKLRKNLILFICSCSFIHYFLDPAAAQEVVQTSEGFYRNLPNQANQDDGWTCGANSASRVLKYYGQNVSYPQVRGVAQQDHGIIPTKVCIGGGKVCIPFTSVCTEKPKECFDTSQFKTGLEPNEVQALLSRWEGGNAKLSTRANFDDLKARVQEGKPVIVLKRVGSFKPGLGIFGTWPVMHWVTVHGLSETAQKIYYTDTSDNSTVRPQSYSEFLSEWDWSIGAGLANEMIWGKGVRPKTMVWVDRSPRLESDLIAQIQGVHNQVIGGDGGPLYVDAAKDILGRGTLQDVRNFLVNDFSEAPIQRVHNHVIGGDGGPLYVDAAKSILRRDGASLQDVRNFLIQRR